MGKRSENTIGASRAHEKLDCAFYTACLTQAAKGKKYHKHYHSGGSKALPCEGCTRYERESPRQIDPWRQQRWYAPYGLSS